MTFSEEKRLAIHLKTHGKNYRNGSKERKGNKGNKSTWNPSISDLTAGAAYLSTRKWGKQVDSNVPWAQILHFEDARMVLNPKENISRDNNSGREESRYAPILEELTVMSLVTVGPDVSSRMAIAIFLDELVKMMLLLWSVGKLTVSMDT